MGSAAGALKCAARKSGCTVEEYRARVADGEKWCTRCKAWHERAAFVCDASRYDGLTAACAQSRNKWARDNHVPVPPEKRARMGTAPLPARDGDKRQARRRVNLHVRMGRWPKPDDLPCADCGHVWTPGDRRHEYHHEKGYSAEHHEDVVALCTTCHRARDGARSHCKRGHPFDEENTAIDDVGRRTCRACRRERENSRRTAAWWRQRRHRMRGQTA